jgi:hypothetical protein
MLVQVALKVHKWDIIFLTSGAESCTNLLAVCEITLPIGNAVNKFTGHPRPRKLIDIPLGT